MGLAVEMNTFGTSSQVTYSDVDEHAMGALCYVCCTDDGTLDVF